MSGFQFFERELRLATAGLEPAAINRELAAFARREVRRVIAEGLASPNFQRYVNGVADAVEETVKAPGPIIYEFINWPLVITEVLAELKARSPRKSGRFTNLFIVISRGRLITNYAAIPQDAEVIVTNAAPYARKAEIGRLGIPARRLFGGTKNVMNRRFRGAFRFESRFLNISSGVHPLIPYSLRRSRGRRRETQAGQPIAYPAIIINVDI